MAEAREVVILGAGGFGREVLDLVRDANRESARWRFMGFVDPEQPPEGLLERIDARWLGDDGTFLANPTATHYIAALGEPSLRKPVVQKYEGTGMIPAPLYHPTAIIGTDTTLGLGTIVGSYASLTTNIRVGKHVHIDRSVTIGHDCTIGDYVTLHPGVTISGGVTIGDSAVVGTNSCVLPGCTVGAGATIGAGAVVISDVPENRTFAGVPAQDLHPTLPGNPESVS